MDRSGAVYYTPPTFCGLGTGQHIYLQAHPAEEVAASLTIVVGSGEERRRWSVRVTQVELQTKTNRSYEKAPTRPKQALTPW